MDEVKKIWVTARRRGHINSGPTRPGPGMAAVVLALVTYGSLCGADLVRITGRTGPPIYRWLHKLEAFGLAEVDFVIERWGRSMEFWMLTADGKNLANALAAERGQVAA